LIYILYTIHVIVCLFLILVVLLQQGKGADLSVFGGGTTQAAFGARGAATLLHKMTVVGFVAFILTTTGIGFLQSGGSQSSVMSTVGEEAPVVEEATPAEVPAPAEAADTTGAVEAQPTSPDQAPESAADESSDPETQD
jgi:preprotein translocase subunit SecG